jgi:hypothetical protein
MTDRPAPGFSPENFSGDFSGDRFCCLFSEFSQQFSDKNC